MQTFLPYPNFVESAKCLDDKRLGKQRVECLQILNVLQMGPYQKKLTVPQNGPYGIWESCFITEYEKATARVNPQHPFGFIYRRTPWYNHPAVQMWKGFEYRLTCYGIIICEEWKERGFADTCFNKILDHQHRLYHKIKARYKIAAIDTISEQYKPYPTWFGNPEFHASHRSNLLRKSPEHYSQFGWTESHNLPYIWPTKLTH